MSENLKKEWKSGRKISKEVKEKAKKWMHSCGRKSFTMDKISKDTYSWSLPFVRGNG